MFIPRSLLVWAAGLGFLTAMLSPPCGHAQASRPKRQPNVLFIAVDDLRPELGCYGATKIISPHIDTLAASGMVFTRAYCQQAVCAPSRISLLTGMRPDTTGIYDLKTPLRTKHPDMMTIPRWFKQHGYRTISLGKIYHHGNDDPEGWSEKPWHPERAWPGYAVKENIEMMNEYWRKRGKGGASKWPRGPAVEAGDLPDESYADAETASKAIETLRRVKDEPFFLAVGFSKPHLPFACPKRYWDLYPAGEIQLPSNPYPPKDVPQIALHNFGELRSYGGVPKDGPVSEAQARELIHGYYACVSFIDAQIGRILAELDQLGLRDNTVIVLWGDHGWHLLDQGLWCKHSNFEVATRAPLIFSYPKRIQAGLTTGALTEFVDVFPTLCDLARLDQPTGLEGVSLGPVFKNPQRPWKSAAFSQYPRGKRVMGYSMRSDRYRYTEWLGRKKNEAGKRYAFDKELYDYENDPQGNVNLANRPEHQALVSTLSRALRAGWRGALPQ